MPLHATIYAFVPMCSCLCVHDEPRSLIGLAWGGRERSEDSAERWQTLCAVFQLALLALGSGLDLTPTPVQE
jgi:hypothetical protein